VGDLPHDEMSREDRGGEVREGGSGRREEAEREKKTSGRGEDRVD